MKTRKWSPQYSLLTERNIGIVSRSQQEKLRNSCVAVLGLGGLGGVVAEVLTRCGIGKLKLVDRHIFEPTNLNRQMFAFVNTVKRKKVEVIAEFLKKINPEIRLEKYFRINALNADKIMNECDVIVLALDGIKECVLMSRIANEKCVPLIEGWALPYGNVRVISRKTQSLEQLYKLPTIHKNIRRFSESSYRKMRQMMVQKVVMEMRGAQKYYDPKATKRMKKGQLAFRSFCPMVRLTADMMALETIKVILGWGKIAYAPRFAVYDPFQLKTL